MGKPIDNLRCPAQPHWDMVFTRLSRRFLDQVEICVEVLAPCLRAAGLWGDLQVRQTPRGISAFFAVAGDRGLLFIVDFTLADGMIVARYPGASADVRLLNARGDVLAHCPPRQPGERRAYHATFEQVVAADGECLEAGSVYAMASTYFDISRPARITSARPT